jgi:hypothetical protein
VLYHSMHREEEKEEEDEEEMIGDLTNVRGVEA